MNDKNRAWFYEENGERKGPVSEPEFLKFIANRQLGFGSSVWTNGFTSWKNLEDTELRSVILGPPPLPGSMANNSVVWVLAFAPFLGFLLQLLLVVGKHGDNEKLIIRDMQSLNLAFIPLILNVVLGYWDEARLRKGGIDTSKFRGITWLVPVYLFQRAKYLKQSFAYFITWILCVGLVSLFPWDFEDASSPPVTSIVQKNKNLDSATETEPSLLIVESIEISSVNPSKSFVNQENISSSQTRINSPSQLDVCAKLDLTINADQRSCLNLKFNSVDKEINETYRDLYKSLAENEKLVLKKEQVSWIKEKEKKCAAVEEEFQGGTFGATALLGCMLQMTEDRLLYLKSYK